MSISLYDISVASYLQVVPAVSKLLDKAIAHFEAQGVKPDEMNNFPRRLNCIREARV